MSDSQGLPDLSAYMPQPDGQQEVTGPTETGQGDNASLSNDFLKNVPDPDRAVVSKYVKDWDAGVTKRFQEIHDQYTPYKELGDVDSIRRAIEVYDLLDNSPEVVYETLKQHFNEMQPQQPTAPSPQNLTPPTQLNPQLQQALEPFMAPMAKQLSEQQAMMEKMAQVILQGSQREQEASEDRALDQYMQELHTKYGNFDERAILMGLYEGKDGDAAVQEWKESLTQYMPQPSTQEIPPPLFGGSTPDDQVDIGSMSDKDVKALTANVFAALQNNQT